MSHYFRTVAAHPAYDEGWIAYQSNEPRTKNPYLLGHREASIAWETGWSHAELDEMPDEPPERESE